jgi:hypothetical protein
VSDLRASACRNFAPDSLGEDPAVCSGCLWHAADHDSPFALGWVDGFEGYVNGITLYADPGDPRGRAYDRGRTQGEADRARSR